MKIGAIVQARLGATRLPGKVLKPLPWGSSWSVLEQVLRRLQRCRTVHEVVLATTDAEPDRVLLARARQVGARAFAGSQDDVLDRYFQAAEGLDHVVRITADCPCLDPELVDRCVREHLESGVDFTTNVLPRSYPHGLDTEVMSYSALARAHHQATQPADREHVILYLEQNRDGLTRIHNVSAREGEADPELRLTLDCPEDYTLLCAVFDQLGDDFGARQLVDLFQRKPWLREINARVRQKQTFSTPAEELAAAASLLELHEMRQAAARLRQNG